MDVNAIIDPDPESVIDEIKQDFGKFDHKYKDNKTTTSNYSGIWNLWGVFESDE